MGEGLLVAVRRCATYYSERWAADASTLWVKVSPVGALGAPLLVAASYIPPASSNKLQRCSAATRFERIARHVAQAAAVGAVVIAGDFNACVGVLSGATSAQRADLHGRLLQQLCADTGLELCTGEIPGDYLALGTYRHANTRIDHIVASPLARPWLQHCSVNRRRLDSDHFPLEVDLTLPWVARAAQAASGVPLCRLRWDSTCSVAYSEALRPAALDAVCAAADAENVALSFDLFHAEATRAAGVGGMPLRPARPGPPIAPQPGWFDRECRGLRAAVRRFARRWPGTEAYHALVGHYRRVARRKKRTWKIRRGQALYQELKSDPRSLYGRARLVPLRLPVTLQDPAQWQPFIDKLAHGPEHHGVHLPPLAPGQPHAGPAEPLARPFTAEDVLDATKQLKNGRSCGASGWPAELLRYAYGPKPSPDEPPPHLLLPALTAMLNCWLRAGAVPHAANCSLVVPVHKRGDVALPSNYRPIAVGEPVLRLYAVLINMRLITYTETAGLRAPSQAGFRPGLSTLHQIFTLQHLIDRAAHLKQPLFCCFLDLKGAYDRVPRALLWQSLARLGVPDTLLAAIQSLYTDADYAISVGGRRGACARSTCGVKQGCPLSPTLFGLLLDGLHWALMAGAPDAGPPLACGRRVPDLGYADDFCLLASSALDLQRLLDVAYPFLTSIGMEVSLEKTRVVVFGRPRARAPVPGEWTCGGVMLDRVQEYKYLGIIFSARDGIAATFPSLHDRLNRSWHILEQHFGALNDDVSLALMRAIFQQCVPPAGSYACEVWGVRRVIGRRQRAREKVAQTHMQLWRRLLRLPQGVSTQVVLRELSVRSPESIWLRSACRFWNVLSSAPEGSLQRAVALSDWDDAVSRNVNNWAGSLQGHLSDLGYNFRINRHRMFPIDVSAALECHDARERQCWADCDVCPRTCHSVGAALCKYQRWFALPDGATHNPFFRLPLTLRQAYKVVRFRLGCHELPITAQRNQRLPRPQRLCSHCDQRALGDEFHMLFECPATLAARAPYARLFPPGCTMLEFMHHPDSMAVARCILACLAVVAG